MLNAVFSTDTNLPLLSKRSTYRKENGTVSYVTHYDEKTSHPQYIKGILRSRMMDKRLGVQVG